MNRNVIIAGLAIILILFFFQLKPATIVPTSTDYTEEKLIIENEEYAIYEFTWRGYSASSAGRPRCDPTDSGDINSVQESRPRAESALPKFSDNLKTGEYVKAEEVSFGEVSATINACSGQATNGQVIFNKSEANCKIEKAIIIKGEQRARMTCQFKADAYALYNGQKTPASFGQIDRMTARVKFYKEGYPKPVVYQIQPVEVTDSSSSETQTSTSSSTSSSTTTTTNQETKSPNVAKLSFIDRIELSIRTFFTQLWSIFK